MNPLAVKYWESSLPSHENHHRNYGIFGPQDVSKTAELAIRTPKEVMGLVWRTVSNITGVPLVQIEDYYSYGRFETEVHAALKKFVEVKEVNLNDYL